MRWRLVDRLFVQKGSLLAGAAVTIATGVLAFARSLEPWLLVWAAAIVPLTGARLHLALRYQRQMAGRTAAARGPVEIVTPEAWAQRFTYGAWAFGALWGAASLVLLMPGHHFEKMLIIWAQAGIATGAVMRNHVSPAAALGQSLLIQLSLMLVAIATLNPFYAGFSVLILLHIATMRSTARHLGAQAIALLRADVEKTALLDNLNRLNDELRQSNAVLSALSMTDDLTGIANRRRFFARLNDDWYRCRRQGMPLSLLLIDVDHFKAFNDHYGHPAGDACLRAVAATLETTLQRSGDIAARYGGEEFAVLLSVEPDGAEEIARRVHDAIATLAIPHQRAPGGTLTVSIGIATVRPGPAATPGRLIEAADRGLYQAKRDGRDRSCFGEVSTTARTADPRAPRQPQGIASDS